MPIKWDNDELTLINCLMKLFVLSVNMLNRLTTDCSHAAKSKSETVDSPPSLPYRPLQLYFLELFMIFPFNQCYLKTYSMSHTVNMKFHEYKSQHSFIVTPSILRKFKHRQNVCKAMAMGTWGKNAAAQTN